MGNRDVAMRSAIKFNVIVAGSRPARGDCSVGSRVVNDFGWWKCDRFGGVHIFGCGKLRIDRARLVRRVSPRKRTSMDGIDDLALRCRVIRDTLVDISDQQSTCA